MYPPLLILARVWGGNKMTDENIDLDYQVCGVQPFYIMKEKGGQKSHGKEGVQWNF